MNLKGINSCLYLAVIAVFCTPAATSYQRFGSSLSVQETETNAVRYCYSLGINTFSIKNEDGTDLKRHEIPEVYHRCLKEMAKVLTSKDELSLIDKIAQKIGQVTVQRLDRVFVDIKNIKELLKRFTNEECDKMIQNNSTKDLVFMSYIFRDWPKEMIHRINANVPDLSKNLEAVANYADSVWWKEILSYIWFPSNFFKQFLTIEKIVRQSRYQTTLLNFLQHYGRRIECRGEVLQEIFDFDIRRETQILKESFNQFYTTLCISNKPIDYIREILQDKVFKDLSVGAIILLIENGDELKNKIRELNLNFDPKSGWDNKTVLYHLAQCLKMENCNQALAQAIPSAQKISLNSTIFNDLLNCNVVYLRYERIIALNFIAALKTVNIQFVIRSEKDAEDVRAFMTMIFILDRTEKEKNQKDVATLSQGLIGFLEKVFTTNRQKWEMPQIIDFLEKSTLNRVEVPDYPLMLEVSNQSSPEKILMIQNMFSNLNLWKIGDKTIWTLLKERNVNLDLYSFVEALNKEDVSSSAVITNFFTNEKLVNCSAGSVLSIAYYSKALGYTLTSIKYKELINEICPYTLTKLTNLRTILYNATRDKLEYNKLYHILLQANGKVTSSDSVNSQVKYGREQSFQNTVNKSLRPDLIEKGNSQQTRGLGFIIPPRQYIQAK